MISFKENPLVLPVSLILIFSFLSCFSPPTVEPILSETYITGKRTSRNLIIFLPGRFSTYTDFDEQGFIERIRRTGTDADAIAVEAHSGYYVERTLLERLLEDVIEPARSNGYRKIWIVATSMGGTGASLYAQKYPETIDGILLIAPFLGDRPVIREIQKAGGIRKWIPGKPYRKGDYQRPLWEWYQVALASQDKYPVICCGYGREDRYKKHIDAVDLIAAEVPARQVYIVSGGHEWEPWLEIFSLFLESGLFP